MKILQINAVFGIRSTGRLCKEIADYLNNNGHEGYVAYSSGLPYEKGYVIGTAFGKKLHALQSRIWGLQAYFSKRGTRKFLEYMDNLKPDVVHLHNLHSNYINLKILLTYLAQKDIPTVLTLHDCWFFTGKCCHYTVDKCFKWQEGCFACPRLHKDNPSWFFDRTTKMYNDKKELFSNIPRLAVVGVSDWITNEAKKSFLSSAKIITKIYNCIDLDVFRSVATSDLRKRMGLENKFVILGVASGWSNAKGLDKFIELAGILKDGMKIILVGGMKDNVPLPENIVHVKETDNIQELVQYYSMADVLLNLSPEETFGMVTAEAIACGTPAIVTNSTANPEIVGHNCGDVVKKECAIDVLLRIMLKIKKKGKKHYESHCLTFAQKTFNSTQGIKDYINLYLSSMQENPKVFRRTENQLKVATMTFHWGANYGAVLQAYALQQYLQQNQFSTEIINYIPLRTKFIQTIMRIKNMEILEFVKEIRIAQFRRKHLNLSKKTYYTNSSLVKRCHDYDAYVCGSDQIWNTSFIYFSEGKPNLSYFLNFVKPGKARISYAASFGTNKLTSQFIGLVKPELEKFKNISVRENTGKAIIESMGCQPTMVVDPTLLLKESSYEKLFENKIIQKKYQLFSYILHKKQSIAHKISDYLLDKYFEHGNGRKHSKEPMSIIEWLFHIRNAKFVITNSFHGLVFSIIFHTPFIVVRVENSEMNDRINTLLNLIDLNKRIIDNYDESAVDCLVSEQIDWDRVDEKVETLRAESVDFLKRALLVD